MNEFLVLMKEALEKELERRFPQQKYLVFENTINKNNGIVLTGLVVKKESKNVGSTYYLDSYYQDYVNGRTIDSCVDSILSHLLNTQDTVETLNASYTDFFDFQEVNGKIVMHLINTERNQALLDKCPNYFFGDLSIVFYIALNNDKSLSISEPAMGIHITNSLMEVLNVSTNVLFSVAMSNMKTISKTKISSMYEALMDIEDMLDTSFEDDLMVAPPLEMFVLTNESKLYGAANILDFDSLNRLSKKFNKNLYILPSSVHECILVPQSDSCDWQSLLALVEDVNLDFVSQSDFLSNNVYLYDKDSNTISLASDIAHNPLVFCEN